MRRILWIGAWCSIAATAHADPFDDFRIPDHTARSGQFSFGAWRSWRASGDPSAETRQSTMNTNLNVSLYQLKDSDAIRYHFGTAVQARATRDDSRRRQGSPGFLGRQSQRQELLEQFATLNTSLRANPWVRPVGIEFSANGSFLFRHSWSGANARQENGLMTGSYRDRWMHARNWLACSSSDRALDAPGLIEPQRLIN